MSILDIIEAATPGPWEHDGRGNICDPRVNEMHDDPRIAMSSDADARFIATFDPEHVALIEAVKAAKALDAQMEVVHADPRNEAVWDCAYIHGNIYEDGPTYRVEREAMEAALTPLFPDEESGVVQDTQQTPGGNNASSAITERSNMPDVAGCCDGKEA